ncbi:MAG: S4 domain-containing protein YaaA [Bacilli bacterium]|nr:S4 domain-containing protein YaaA [Bacilli bacterium]
MVEVKIRTEYITLGQFLKLVSVIQSGGEAKIYLLMNDVLVNGEIEKRRGRKIYPGDHVRIDDTEYIAKAHETG